MGLSHSISKIVILISLWTAGMIVMVILMRCFFKHSRSEHDSHYGTERPEETLEKVSTKGVIDKTKFLKAKKDDTIGNQK